MNVRIGITNPQAVLVALGYKRRRRMRDFIKPDVNGRFHAKLEGKKVYLHYDVDVDGTHVAGVPMPIHLKKERARIQSLVDKKRIHGKTN